MTTDTFPLIGLLGAKRSGKDTFAGVLVEEGGFSRVAFADPLKRVALAMDPIIGRPPLPSTPHSSHDLRLSLAIADIGWEAAKDYIPEVRTTCLQNLGQAIRAEDPDFWLRIAMRDVDARTTPVVVTDVRLQNEADAIRERGGVLIRLVRDADPIGGAGADHITETALDDAAVDITIDNDGTLDELREKARKVLYAMHH